MFFEPLDQFEIIFLGYFQSFPLTNMFLYLLFIYYTVKFFFRGYLNTLRLSPFGGQALLEIIYSFVFSLIKQNIGKKGFPYFPLIFTLFIFILFSNLLGMAFYSFTVTSHLIITFTLSFSMFIGVLIIGIIIQKKHFIDTFIPSGAPKALLPFLVVIEFISYVSKPFSLGIRLFANMMSGHSLLSILGNFSLFVIKKSWLIALIPLGLITLIIGLEVMIAGLQAYVFVVLVCIYLSDSIHGAH